VGIDKWEDYVVIDPKFYRPAEVDYLLGFPDKAKSDLGWSLDVSFKDLVHRMTEGDVNGAKLQRPDVQEIQAGCAKA